MIVNWGVSNMTNEHTNNRVKAKHQLWKPFTTYCFLQKKKKKEKMTSINRREPKEILKIIWHIQSKHKQNTHCLLLSSSPAD